MNIMRLFLGVLVLFFALLCQIWFPVGGVHGDFVLAALIAFAFIFSFWECLFFILLSAFVINWQPGLSADLLAFALMPVAAFVVHFWLRWEPWIGIAVSVAAGVFAFYGITAPAAFFPNLAAVVADAIACVIWGELVLWGVGNS